MTYFKISPIWVSAYYCSWFYKILIIWYYISTSCTHDGFWEKDDEAIGFYCNGYDGQVPEIIKDSPLVLLARASTGKRDKAPPLEAPRFLCPIATPCHGISASVDRPKLNRLTNHLLVSVKASSDKEVIDLADSDLSAIS